MEEIKVCVKTKASKNDVFSKIMIFNKLHFCYIEVVIVGGTNGRWI